MRAALLLTLAALAASAAPVPKALKAKRPDAEVFVGTWELVVSEHNGKPHPVPHQWTFDPDLTMWSKAVNAAGPGAKWPVKIDPEKSPKHIDIGPGNNGIYEIDGDEIRIVYSGQRPANFDDKGKMNYTVLRRVKDKEGGK
jgi:uncharacterized protein (TIGR03067 family)